VSEEQHRLELLKLYVEFFKHMTTLSAAAAVVLLTVYREGVAQERLIAASLGMFAVAVITSLIGMQDMIVRVRIGKDAGWMGEGLMMLSSAALSAGLVAVLWEAFDFPYWPLYILTVVLILAISGILIYRYRRRRTSSR
jgi:hypothetical protein